MNNVYLRTISAIHRATMLVFGLQVHAVLFAVFFSCSSLIAFLHSVNSFSFSANSLPKSCRTLSISHSYNSFISCSSTLWLLLNSCTSKMFFWHSSHSCLCSLSVSSRTPVDSCLPKTKKKVNPCLSFFTPHTFYIFHSNLIFYILHLFSMYCNLNT